MDEEFSVGEGTSALLTLPQLRAWGQSSDFLRATLHLLGTVLGPEASVQIVLPERGGRLRVVARLGSDRFEGRLRSARRRQALESGDSIDVPLRKPSGRVFRIFPLVGGGGSMGVVEVIAPASVLSARYADVREAVDRSASELWALMERAASEPAWQALNATLQLASGLLGARTRVAAIRATVAICSSQFEVPIAGVLPDRSLEGWYVAAVRGLGARKEAELRAALRELSSRSWPRPEAVAALRERFASVTGAQHTEVVEADAAVLLLACEVEPYREFMGTAGWLLATALEHWKRSPSRDDALDLGIAWTAHELKTPLLGAKAAIDHLLLAEGNSESRELLFRAASELAYLADLVEPLLRWAAGSGELHRRPVDLVGVVRDAVASCMPEPEEERVTIAAPDRLPARVDNGQLRGAVANVVRNALAYSPQMSPVIVSVERKGEVARIRVLDHGPGIPPEEQRLIFHPLARGRAGGRSRGGKGLGLFIARRIVEAHGGTITLESSAHGAAFCMQVPLSQGGLPHRRPDR
jgi:signal transduction histidine kinase